MQYEDENGVNELSRRRLLKGIGALALAGSCPVAHAENAKCTGHAFTGCTQ
ncbi:twin-arginine translocation signal domain-containing protein [Escherichia coli]